jgi:hypothetical protein
MEQRQRRVVGTSPDLSQNSMSPGQKSAAPPQRTVGTTGPLLASRQFRRARAAELLNAVSQLDAVVDDQVRRQVAEWIAGHYANEYGGTIPLGFLATCRLGPPYVDHRLSLLESILEHYSPSSAVPAPFSEARSLVRSGAYLYVEIYSDGQLVPVRIDGTVVTP